MPAALMLLETRLKEVADACATDPKHRGVLSTSEQLTVAIILNREDWLREWKYTKQEAIDRIGPEWNAAAHRVAKARKPLTSRTTP